MWGLFRHQLGLLLRPMAYGISRIAPRPTQLLTVGACRSFLVCPWPRLSFSPAWELWSPPQWHLGSLASPPPSYLLQYSCWSCRTSSVHNMRHRHSVPALL